LASARDQNRVAVDREVVKRFVETVAVGRADRLKAATKSDPGVSADVRTGNDADPADPPGGVITHHHEADAAEPGQLPDHARVVGEDRPVGGGHRRR